MRIDIYYMGEKILFNFLQIHNTYMVVRIQLTLGTVVVTEATSSYLQWDEFEIKMLINYVTVFFFLCFLLESLSIMSLLGDLIWKYMKFIFCTVFVVPVFVLLKQQQLICLVKQITVMIPIVIRNIFLSILLHYIIPFSSV